MQGKEGQFYFSYIFHAGSMGRAATIMYQCLASLLSEKWKSPYIHLPQVGSNVLLDFHCSAPLCVSPGYPFHLGCSCHC